ncbi:MAG: hypothetical protein GY778_14920 [bacterium]|nr:hypothetical protein [bacterium]
MACVSVEDPHQLRKVNKIDVVIAVRFDPAAAGREPDGTLHRLGLFKELGPSFKTSNCIENLYSLVAQRTDQVDY